MLFDKADKLLTEAKAAGSRWLTATDAQNCISHLRHAESKEN